MNGRTHRAVGAGVGVAATVGFRLIERRPLRVAELAGAVVGGTFGGGLPDILEPATSPNHRAVMHSISVSGSALYGAVRGLGRARERLDSKADELWARAQASQNWLEKLFLYLSALAVDFVTGALTAVVPAYVSHVVCDATTPRGVPVFGVS